MARILSVQSEVPERSFGGRKRVFHLTEALCEAGHEVHMLIAMSRDDAPSLPALEEMGVRAYPVFYEDNASRPAPAPPKTPLHAVGRKIDGKVRFQRRLLREITGSVPRATQAHWVAPLRRELRALLQRKSFDLVAIENEENADLAREAPRGVPTLVVVQNVLSSVAEREVTLRPRRSLFTLQGLSVRAQPSKLRRFERAMLMRCDAVVAMSELEAQRLRELAPEFGSRVHVVENGVDVARYQSMRPPPGGERLIYTGLMSYYPNADAMLWFLRDIWPLVLRARPNAQLDIIGAEPPPSVCALAEEFQSVHVSGRVPKTQPYFERADVMIVPLRNGGGTRLKILEASAMQRPIVSTSVGAEGLDGLRDGEHLLLRDSPQEFAQGIVQLLEDRELGARLASAARKVVEERYDWPLLGRKFERVVAQTAQKNRENGKKMA